MNIAIDGMKLFIERDDSPIHPRLDCDNLGTMLCWHRRYNLGDRNPYAGSQEFWDDTDTQDDIFVKMKVYGFDHGEMTISNAPFSCQWDSGVLGIIYASKTDVLKEYGNLSDETKNLVKQRLSGEIIDYNNYLTGDYYVFVIEDLQGNTLDSCGSFSGKSMTEVLTQMKDTASTEYNYLFDKLIQSSTKQDYSM